MIRRQYVNLLEEIVGLPIEPPCARDFDVYTFSSERHVPEQVASIRSLLRHFGEPARILIVSDGSHTPRSTQLLSRIHPTVSVAHHRDVTRGDLPAAVTRYAHDNPMGVKLALELSMPIARPTIYMDADVLCFPGISGLAAELSDYEGQPRYLPDFDQFLDESLLVDEAEAKHPVNAGFQVLTRPLEWEPALERLERAARPPSFLSEQTLVHLAMHASSALPLRSDLYVLEVDDEHDWRDRHGGPDIALRHYCFSLGVQEKLWLNVWHDILVTARRAPRTAAMAGLAAVRGWWSDRRG